MHAGDESDEVPWWMMMLRLIGEGAMNSAVHEKAGRPVE
jgi:hypothetical protein